MHTTQWRGFKGGDWTGRIDVRDFIQLNYTPYVGGGDFLSGATERTEALNRKYLDLREKELRRGGVLDIDTETVSSLLNYEPGYLDKENEIIVGLQTGAPLRRSVNPFGGIRMVASACKAYGYQLSPKVREQFKYRTTHNDGVYRVYTEQMRAARHAGVITGLPDAYGRGRIIGDYRRVALYGTDRLMAEKQQDMLELAKRPMVDENIRLREEVTRQIDFLSRLCAMGVQYGFDLSRPADNAREAVQWVYFAYLAAVKEQNGAAMSLGRVSTFLDVYFERDIIEGTLTEQAAQEIMDQFVLKLRMVRQLRTPEYNELFAGDPNWITEAVGGMGEDGRTLVTRTSYRMLHTLHTLLPAPEPNLTVLWSKDLPAPFKEFCAQLSIDTDSIQYENDDLMRPRFGDDYAIACCVSAMKVGKQMQFFGARCNLAKVLLLALNGGRDERSGEAIAPLSEPVADGPLTYTDVKARFDRYVSWLCELYVNTMNIIHYMHDKYAYEKIQMALHDTEVERLMAFGMAGLSVVTDSLCAIRYAKVTPIRDERGIIQDFTVEGEFPCFGNDDGRADGIAVDLCEQFIGELRKYPTYRDAVPTLSILTITSNVVYGKKTGATPDGRKAGQPFAPGANPMHGREKNGAIAALSSVAKLPYDACRDGVSNTFTITPETLGDGADARRNNLVDLLDGYFTIEGDRGAHHLNVNVLRRAHLEDAMEHPEKYPNLTIRVSGYAVRFVQLSRAQQQEVISRTFHTRL